MGAGNVTFVDNSLKIKAEINEITLTWLHEAAHEVEAHAQRNCKMEDEMGVKLRSSYEAIIDSGAGKAQIGSPMEAAYWEEFGTGSHAVDTSKSRKGWWVYVKNNANPFPRGGKTYNTEAEAQAVAESMRKDGLDAYATNGRDPQHTLQNAFVQTMPKSERKLEELLKGGLTE